MSKVTVPMKTATLVNRTQTILEAKGAGEDSQFANRRREVPEWLPNGEEVKTVAQAAALMGTSNHVAALYVMESKGIDPELTADADLELKVVRHIRTNSGSEKHSQPVGTVITQGTPLKHLTDAGKSEFIGFDKATGSNGKTYYIGKDPDSGQWVCTDGEGWDNVVVDGGKSQEEAYHLLNHAVGGSNISLRKNSAPIRGNAHTEGPSSSTKLYNMGKRAAKKAK